MFNRLTLSNGVRVVAEKLSNVRSLSIGIWVGTGSRNEKPEYNGVSHFIEHMMFKGTKKRSAKQIAEEIDSIGGQINAFTAKEATCYYTKTLDSHYEKAIELLADIFFESTFSEDNINTEKGVILEEIGMYQDSLEDLVHDLLVATVWKNNSLSYPILGTNESLKNINREKILDYYKQRYIPQNIVISIAGNFDLDQIINTIKKYFEKENLFTADSSQYEVPTFNGEVAVKTKQSEQTHISIALEGIEYGSDELYSLLTVNNIFGGSMSSRLFQNIREKRGLAYSVYSFPSSYQNVGIFNIYAGLNSSNISEVIKLTMDEINILKQHGLNDEEIAKSKEQLKGNYMLGLEGTGNRMSANGKAELLLGNIFSPDEILAKIEKINRDSINNIISKVFDTSKICMALVGKVDEKVNYKKLLETN